MVREVAVLICQIRLWNHIASRADDFSKRRILPGRARDQRHIIGTCIMIVAVKPVRIGKMRIHTSDLRSPCIHHICKSTDASADILCHTIRNVICRCQHNPICRIPQGYRLSRLDTKMRASLLKVIDNLRKRNPIVQITVFHQKQRRHDLRNTRRIHFLCRIFTI